MTSGFDFQCHLDDFKENQMTKKVLIRLMNDWTQNDTKKAILLKEWIMSIEELNRLKAENEKLRLDQNSLPDTPNQLIVEESQDKDTFDFQCHLDDFKENQMTKKVLIRLMNDWTQNDTKKTILLKEWIMSIEEINRLKAENEKIRLEKIAEDDVANLIFQHDDASEQYFGSRYFFPTRSEQEKIKVEIKEEDVEIHD